jgi:hypothetical protein
LSSISLATVTPSLVKVGLREVLTSLAKLLIEKEVVSRDDLTALLASAEA